MAWNRAAVQAAQAAALAKKRAEERAAAEARRAAAREASAARRAAAQAAAEEAKATKRAAKLAAMPPQRAWQRMTPEERLLKIAEAELGVYGEVLSPEAKAAYDRRAANRPAAKSPAPTEPAQPRTAAPVTPAATDIPAYLRALDLNLSPRERALAKERAAGDPEQWQKYVAALRAQRADDEIATHGASITGGNGVPAHNVGAAGHAARGGPPPSQPEPPLPAASPNTRPAATRSVRGESGSRPAASPQPRRSGVTAGGAADARRPGNTAAGNPVAAPPDGFGGDGLFVAGLDIRPGVYRTAGPVSGSRGYFALLKSTSTRDIIENSIVTGPATITVGPGVKAVQVCRCQPWSRLGDNLDDVIAAASKPRDATGRG